MNPDPIPDALELAVAWTSVFGSIGVVVAVVGLAIQIAKSRGEATEREAQAVVERDRFDKQMKALQQAENDRLAAQARKIVPSIQRADYAYGPNTWAVRIQNKSTDVVTDLAVLVTGFGDDGKLCEESCYRLENVELSPLVDGIFSDAIGGAVGEIVQQFSAATGLGGLLGGMGGMPGMGNMPGMMRGASSGVPGKRQTQDAIEKHFGPEVTEKLQDAVQSAFNGDWPTTLIPAQSETRIYVGKDATLDLHVAIQYEDSGGYLWNRNDRGKPERVSGIDPNPPRRVPAPPPASERFRPGGKRAG